MAEQAKVPRKRTSTAGRHPGGGRQLTAAQRKARALQRELTDRMIFDLHLVEGKSFRDIGQQMGLAKTAVHKRFTQMLQAHASAHRDEELVELELQRLDLLQGYAMREAIQDVFDPETQQTEKRLVNLMALDRVIRIHERRCKLLGIDAPTKIDISDLMRRLAEEEGIDPAEAVAEAERIARTVKS